jgi:hypothetical protein
MAGIMNNRESKEQEVYPEIDEIFLNATLRGLDDATLLSVVYTRAPKVAEPHARRATPSKRHSANARNMNGMLSFLLPSSALRWISTTASRSTISNSEKPWLPFPAWRRKRRINETHP